MKTTRLLFGLVMGLLVTMSVGCEELQPPKQTASAPTPPAPPPRPAQSPAPPPAVAPVQPVAEQPATAQPPEAPSDASSPGPTQPESAPAVAEPAAPTSAEQPAAPATAQPGKEEPKPPARKPRKYNSKYISDELKTSWSGSDRGNFYKFQSAMINYQKENGRRPDSYAEFMQEVIRKNNVELPALPRGHEFHYDPAKGLLATRSTQPGSAPPPAPPTVGRGPATPPAPPKPSGKAEKAKVGVGKKGRGYGGDMVTEPIRQRFLLEDQINFQLMERALRDFKTLNERLPKSHAEFMTEIVEKNAIKLPVLPEGDEYIYDPKTGELMVRHPKSAK